MVLQNCQYSLWFECLAAASGLKKELASLVDQPNILLSVLLTGMNWASLSRRERNRKDTQGFILTSKEMNPSRSWSTSWMELLEPWMVLGTGEWVHVRPFGGW